MSNVFISYSRKDGSEVAEWLYTSLEGAGYSVWKDTHSVKPGDNFPLETSIAIDENHYFIYLISKASIESALVQDEIGNAKAQKKKIIPIVIDDSPLPSYIVATQALELKNGIRDWDVLHKLVSGLKGGSDIPRVVNMSGHVDIGVKGILVLKHFSPNYFEFKQPGELPKLAQKLGAEALPIIKKTNAGIVPHGHPAIASAVQAYLSGVQNEMPDLYYTFKPPKEKYGIYADKVVHLQDIREIGLKDRKGGT